MKITRVMAAVVCGAIVASSASVSAFASTPYDNNAEGIFYRPVHLTQTKGGYVELSGVINAPELLAACDRQVTVKVSPEDGYTFKGLKVMDNEGNEIYTGVYGGQNAQYSFVMPWCNEAGVTVIPEFAPAK